MPHRPISAILYERAEAFRRVSELDAELVDAYAADIHDAADHTQRAISSQILHFVELSESRIAHLADSVAALAARLDALARDFQRLRADVARVERALNGGASNGGGVYE